MELHFSWILPSFAAMVFVFAIYRPDVMGGTVVGLHSIISSLGALTGLQWSAILMTATLAGQMTHLLWHRKCRLNAEAFWSVRNAIPALLFLLTLIAGVTGEIRRNLAIETGIPGGFNLAGITSRENGWHSVIVLTRWIPYFFVCYLGILSGKIERLLLFFSLGVVLQLFALPYPFIERLIEQYLDTGIVPGFDWKGVNRAYIGYESCIAASFCGLQMLETRWRRESLGHLGILMGATLVVAVSASKGPLLAIGMVYVILIGASLVRRFATLAGLFAALLLLLVILVGSIHTGSRENPQHDAQMDRSSEPILGKLRSNMRVAESAQIRLRLIERAAYPGVSTPAGLLIGRGFGWSRYQRAADGSAEFADVGTHVFWIDLYLDTGLLGSIAFLMALAILIGNRDASSPLKGSWLIGSLGLIWLIKSILASDSYSEPIPALWISVLFAQNGPKGSLA